MRNGQPQSLTIAFAMRLIAGVLLALPVLPVQAGNMTISYTHTDVQGNVIAVTDQNQAVIERRQYEPYGLPQTPITDDTGYTGHLHDGDTGLVYMQQRYYDPQIGQFLSVDPVLPSDTDGSNFNRYWYANNNPYKYVDPDGEESIFSDALKDMFDVRAGNDVQAATQVIAKTSGVGEMSSTLSSISKPLVDSVNHISSEVDSVSIDVTVGATAPGHAAVVRGSISTDSASIFVGAGSCPTCTKPGAIAEAGISANMGAEPADGPASLTIAAGGGAAGSILVTSNGATVSAGPAAGASTGVMTVTGTQSSKKFVKDMDNE